MVKSFGIVGCGAVVQEFYVRVLPRVSGIRVAGVCDLNQQAAQQVAGSMGTQVLDLPGLLKVCDWVLVATPPESHFRLAKTVLEAGRNVTLEKPFVTSRKEAQSLVDLARTQERAVCVAQFRRVFGPTELARQLVSNGVIGRVEALECFEGGKFAWTAQSDYVSRSPFGGVLYDTGSHTVDQALYVAGMEMTPLEVSVNRVVRDKVEPSHEIQAWFDLKGPDRTVTGRLYLSRAQTLGNLVRVVGSEGWIELDIGVTGGVTLGGRGQPVRLTAEGSVSTYADAFKAEYTEIFGNGTRSLFRGETTLNQIGLIEAIHQHGA